MSTATVGSQPAVMSDRGGGAPADPARVFGYVIEPAGVGEREPAPPLPTGVVSVNAVPAAHRPAPQPLIRVLMPVVMVVAIIAMVGLLVLTSGRMHPMLLIMPLMLGMSMLMMFSPPDGDDTDETRRTYLRHLGAVRNKALDNAEAQRRHEHHRHPDPVHLWSQLGGRRMWERCAADPDCLEVRVGIGTTALCTPVEVGDPGAPEDLDPVCAVSLRRTVRAVGTVHDMPVAVQLQAFRFLGLTGPGAGDLARSIVVQLLFHHGPDVVAVEAVGRGWKWLKWVPHSRDADNSTHRVLIVDSQLTTGVEGFIDDPRWTTIIDVGAVSTTALGQRAEQEGLLIHVDDMLTVVTATGPEEIGRADRVTDVGAATFGRQMTAYRRPLTTEHRASGDLLPMLGLADITLLTPESMWRHGMDGHRGATTLAPNRVRDRTRLTVPLGLSAAGTPLVLDLKESAHGGMGPHGLCIGATGSGKSELLRTLVAGLIVTHPPDELNLVLVDFKGGATFLGLDRLPHTSAVITNLSEESILVERMHDAISGEMNRRQELLRKAGNFSNVTDHNEAAADREDLSPIPALLIVIDEFSELLGHHPDFADLFVAVGRLGRSLGIHLLLASQRLEEGRLRGLDSHLSYRIGLRTFSAAESRQVLGVADAYHLSAQPGAGYLRSDAEDVTRFQAAYVSGPVTRIVAGEKGQSGVRPWNGWDDGITESTRVVSGSETLVDALVSRAAQAGKRVKQSAHPIWLPPLPEEISVADVADQMGELKAAIGVIDRPYLQRQDPLVLDFAGSGGHWAICGGPQTGKSTALRTTVISLSATHGTHQIRFYVLDLSGTSLMNLDRLPHVAGVAHRGQPERVRRMVDEVLALVDAPESRHTFLVIDGWHGVSQDFEDLFDSLARIAADGLASRVHLLVGTPRWTALRPAVRDLITGRMELRLGEAMDSMIDRKAQQKLPSAPGRGLTSDAEHMLIANSSPQDIAYVVSAANDSGQSPVPALKVLPPVVHHGELSSADTVGMPVAMGGRALRTLTWDPQDVQHVLAFGSQGSGKSTLLTSIATGITKLGRQAARMVVIDPRRTHLGEFAEDMVAAYAATSTAVHSAVADVLTTLTARLPGTDITPAELKERSWWEGPEIFLIIDDLDLLSDGVLHPLRDIIPHSRDVGLHIVAARKSGGAARALYDPVLSGIRDQSPMVLLFDADREEGPLFGIKPSPQPVGRATMQVRGEILGVCQIAVPGEAVVP